MKSFDLRSLLIGVLITMIVVVAMLVATSTPRWEYRIVEGYVRNDFQDQLNAAAKDGWEVVSVAVIPQPAQPGATNGCHEETPVIAVHCMVEILEKMMKPGLSTGRDGALI